MTASTTEDDESAAIPKIEMVPVLPEEYPVDGGARVIRSAHPCPTAGLVRYVRDFREASV